MFKFLCRLLNHPRRHPIYGLYGLRTVDMWNRTFGESTNYRYTGESCPMCGELWREYKETDETE